MNAILLAFCLSVVVVDDVDCIEVVQLPDYQLAAGESNPTSVAILWRLADCGSWQRRTAPMGAEWRAVGDGWEVCWGDWYQRDGKVYAVTRVVRTRRLVVSQMTQDEWNQCRLAGGWLVLGEP